jgi:hypothetical protein
MLKARWLGGRTDSFLSPGKHDAVVRELALVTEEKEKGDVWSVGVTMLSLALLEEPQNINKQEREGLIEGYLHRTSGRYCDAFRYILSHMLRIDESERWTFK